MKILVADGMEESGLALFRAAEGVDVDAPGQIGPEEIKEMLPDYDALVVRSRTKVNAELLECGARLKVVGRAGTGVDNIDVKAASTRGVLVMNTPGANAMAAAEHTLALMLSLARHIPQATQSMREGRWEKKLFMGTELFEQTLGIIGLGKIGSIVADRAMGMKMEVLGYDPYLTPETAAIMGIKWAPIKEIFARSDFITIHTPLTKETKHFVNRESIAAMKPGVRIINCARGGLVDEAALFEGLAAGRIAGAALDVFEKEPPGDDNPLLGLKNVIFTPHLGASSFQAQVQVATAMASQILDYLLRGIIRNAVNFPSVGPKVYEKIRPYLALAELLGSLQGQMCASIRQIRVEFSGPHFQDIPLQPLTQSVIKGFLDPILAERVNLVNAPLLLKERNIDLVTSTTSEAMGYTGLITVRVKSGDQELSAAGAVFPGDEYRLVRLNDYRLEAELEGVNLLIQNLDRPGVIGFIGSALGDFRINIANMHLSRTPQRDSAMSIVRVDEEAPPEALRVLRGNPNILSVRQVKLKGGEHHR